MKNFTKKEVQTLFPNAVLRKYPSGQIVIYQGDQPAHMFFISKGSIKYYDIDQNGNEKILHILGENSLFPMFYSIGGYKEIQAFYSTLDDVEILIIPLNDFNARVGSDAWMSRIILGWYVGEVEHMVQRIGGLEKTDAKIKILEAFRYLSQKHSHVRLGGWYQVNFNLSQQMIADLTGLSRETVSNTLKDLDKFNLVRYPKQLTVELHRKRIDKSLLN